MKNCWFFPHADDSFPQQVLARKWIQVDTATGNTYPIDLHFSHIHDHVNHSGIMLKCRFWLSGSGVESDFPHVWWLWSKAAVAGNRVPRLYIIADFTESKKDMLGNEHREYQTTY